MDGIINVYKEKGYTSFDVVAVLRKVLSTKKIGHTGTLDPQAEGVLPVCIGKATRVCDMLTDRDKAYTAVVRLGVTTDTLDMTGEILEEKTVDTNRDEIEEVLKKYVGKIMQVPPMYSALKVNGERLYDLARKGITIERKPREVSIYAINLVEINLPYITIEVDCSKGTYIRSLCDDIGKDIGCGAAMDSLIRTKAAGFEIKDALKLEEISKLKNEGKIDEEIVSIDQVLLDYPAIYAIPEADFYLKNGNKLKLNEVVCENEACFERPLRTYFSDGRFAGIYTYLEESEEFKAIKLFI